MQFPCIGRKFFYSIFVCFMLTSSKSARTVTTSEKRVFWGNDLGDVRPKLSGKKNSFLNIVLSNGASSGLLPDDFLARMNIVLENPLEHLIKNAKNRHGFALTSYDYEALTAENTKRDNGLNLPRREDLIFLLESALLQSSVNVLPLILNVKDSALGGGEGIPGNNALYSREREGSRSISPSPIGRTFNSQVLQNLPQNLVQDSIQERTMVQNLGNAERIGGDSNLGMALNGSMGDRQHPGSFEEPSLSQNPLNVGNPSREGSARVENLSSRGDHRNDLGGTGMNSLEGDPQEPQLREGFILSEGVHPLPYTAGGHKMVFQDANDPELEFVEFSDCSDVTQEREDDRDLEFAEFSDLSHVTKEEEDDRDLEFAEFSDVSEVQTSPTDDVTSKEDWISAPASELSYEDDGTVSDQESPSREDESVGFSDLSTDSQSVSSQADLVSAAPSELSDPISQEDTEQADDTDRGSVSFSTLSGESEIAFKEESLWSAMPSAVSWFEADDAEQDEHNDSFGLKSVGFSQWTGTESTDLNRLDEEDYRSYSEDLTIEDVRSLTS